LEQRLQFVETSASLSSDLPDEAEQLDDLRTNLTQIDEVYLDIEKQPSDEMTVTDFEQLDWLRQRLIESWNTAEVWTCALFPPSPMLPRQQWHQAQTLAIRRRLRWVLDQVSDAVGSFSEGRPLVDLILNGHAHCWNISVLATLDTPTPISTGSSAAAAVLARRQRLRAGIKGNFWETEGGHTRKVAESLLYVGRNGHGHRSGVPTILRIDVQDGRPPKFIVRPYIAERFQRQWSNTP